MKYQMEKYKILEGIIIVVKRKENYKVFISICWFIIILILFWFSPPYETLAIPHYSAQRNQGHHVAVEEFLDPQITLEQDISACGAFIICSTSLMYSRSWI